MVFRTVEVVLFNNAFPTDSIDGSVTTLQSKKTGKKQLRLLVQDLID
jgi:hypothetical protein